MTFTLTLSSDVASGGYILLTYSSGVTLSTSSTYTCTQIYGLNGGTPSCSATSSSVLKVSSIFANTDRYIVFTVASITLPSYSSSFTVTAATYTSSGTKVEESNASTISFNTDTGSLTLAMETLDSSTVGAYTNMQFTVTNGNLIDSTGYLLFKFPKWNPGTQIKSNALSMFSYSSSDYSSTVSAYSLPCSCSAHSSIKCYLTVNTPSSSSTISTTYDYVKVTGFSSSISASSSTVIKFTNSRFRNPPSTKPLTTITVTSYNSNGNAIDSQSTTTSYTVGTSVTLSASSITVTPTSTSINSETTYTFKVTVSMPLPVGSYATLTIPTDIGIFSTDKSSYILNSAIGTSPLYSVLSMSVTDSSTQIIKLTNMIPSSSYYVDEGSTIQFQLLFLRNPDSTGATDKFQLSFYDNDYLIMSLDTSTGYTLTATSGSLQSVSVVPYTYLVSEETTYTFSFITANAIESGGKIQIYIPSDFTVTSSSLAFTAVINTLSTASLSYTSSTGMILISSCFSGAVSASTDIKFQITAGIKNPNSAKTTNSIILYTLDSSGNIIDKSSGTTITATANTISSVKVTACADLQGLGTTNTECTYQLRVYIGTDYPIASDSYIEVDIPTDLSVTNEDSIVDYSYSEGCEDSNTVVTYDYDDDTDAQTITFKSLFTSDDGSTTQYKMDVFSLYITNLTSPRSTAPTSTSFAVRIYNSNGKLSYQKLSGIKSSVQNANYFSKVTIKRSSQMNGNINTTYEFMLNLTQDVLKSEYIKVIFPTGVTIKAAKDQCTGIQNLATILSCSLEGQALYVIVNTVNSSVSNITSGSVIRFSVNNIINPYTFEPTDSFAIFVTTSRNYDYYVQQMTQGLSILNTQPNLLSKVQILPDSSQLGINTSYSFYFTTSNPLDYYSILTIEFPKAAYSQGLTGISCSPLKNMKKDTVCKVSSTNKWLIEISVFIGLTSTLTGGQELGIKLSNIKNPSTSNSANGFTLTTYAQSGEYLVDQAVNISLPIGCQYPCNTCTQSQTQCTSCQFSSNNILYLFKSTCGKSCPFGYYEDNLLSCQKCSFPCESCIGESSQCISCQQSGTSPQYLSEKDFKCYDSCPTGTYPQDRSLTCEACAKPCLECSSEDQCLTCMEGYYFWQGKCYNGNCPNTTVPLTDSSVKECIACKSPCQTCNGTRETCTSCQLSPVTHYLFGNECLQQCPSPYLPNKDNMCVKEEETVYPFLSFGASLLAAAIVLISNIVYPRTRMFTAYLALQSSVMIGIWVYLIYFLIKDGHTSSYSIVGIALIINFGLNLFWYAYYRKKVIYLDKSYRRYTKQYPMTHSLLIFLSYTVSFQLFRLQYSRLFNSPGLSCELDLKHKYYTKLNRYSLIQITMVYMPVIAANIYNLMFTWYGRQVFWIDIESIVASVLVLVAHIVIIIRTDQQYILNKYSLGNDTITGVTKTGSFFQGDTTNNTTKNINTEQGPSDRANLKSNLKQNKNIISKRNEIICKNITSDSLDVTENITIINDVVDVKRVNNKEYQSLAKNQKQKIVIDSDYNELNQESSRTQDDISGGINNTTRINGEDESDGKFYQQYSKKGSIASRATATNQNSKWFKGTGRFDQNEKSPLKMKSSKHPKQNNGKGVSPSKNNKKIAQNSDELPTSMDNKLPPINLGKSYGVKKIIDELSETDSPSKQINGLKGYEANEFEFNNFNDLEEIAENQEHRIMTNIKDKINQQEEIERQQAFLCKEVQDEVQNLQQEFNYESNRKQQLVILVDNLQDQLRRLIDEFDLAQQNRKKELEFLEEANFTSDEEMMGISPSDYNFMNQRFQDSIDIKIQMNEIDGQEGIENLDLNAVDLNQDAYNIVNTSRNMLSGFDDEDDAFKSSPEKRMKTTSNTRKEINSQKSPKRNASQKSKINNTSSKSPKTNASRKSPRIVASQQVQRITTSKKSPRLNASQKSPKLIASQKSPRILTAQRSPNMNKSQNSQRKTAAVRSQSRDKVSRQQAKDIIQKSPRRNAQSLSKYRDQSNLSKRSQSISNTVQKEQKVARSVSKENGTKKSATKQILNSNSRSNSRSISRGRRAVSGQSLGQSIRMPNANHFQNNQTIQLANQNQSRATSTTMKRQKNTEFSKVVPLNSNFDNSNGFSNVQMPPSQNFGLSQGMSQASMRSSPRNTDQFYYSVSMNRDEFLSMLEEEGRQILQKYPLDVEPQNERQRRHQEFAKLAKEFLNQIASDFQNGYFDKSIIDYIRELDKRGRRKIEEKYRLLFQEGIEIRSKIKKKKKQLKKKPLDKDRFNAYFNYLPFEKAVIESNGKTPLTNKELEMLVQNPSLIKQKSNMTQIDSMSNNNLTNISKPKSESK